MVNFEYGRIRRRGYLRENDGILKNLFTRFYLKTQQKATPIHI